MSSTIRLPATEKPWHGGPPIITSTLLPFNIGCVSEGFKIERSAFKTWLSLWLCWKVQRASFQTSIPNITWKPALSKPREKPPHPQNRSMTFWTDLAIKNVKNFQVVLTGDQTFMRLHGSSVICCIINISYIIGLCQRKRRLVCKGTKKMGQ